MKNKKCNNFIKISLLSLLVCIIFIVQTTPLFASDIEDTYEKLEDLDKQSEKINTLIKLKQKEQAVINTQIKKIADQVAEANEEIKNSEKEIEKLSYDINRIKSEVQQKETHITLQKKVLEKFIREKYQNYTPNIEMFTMLNIANNYTQNHKDNLSHATDSVGDFIEKIHKEQEELKKDQINLEKKSGRIQEVKQDLERQNDSLKDVQNYKRVLSAEASAEEAKYQKKLAKIEKQKQKILGDLNLLYNSDIENLIEKAPKKYHASTSWYYSQRDPRWANEFIGNSRSTIEDYGCAISSVAMVFTYYGKKITPKKLSNKSIFYWDLINWPNTWGDLTLSSNITHSGVDWDDIDDAIDDDEPVIVFINVSGGAGHYVVIHHKTKDDRYVVHDPYLGSNIYLDSTIKAFGAMYGVTVSRKKAVDQMILYKEN
ncbi:MAG: hypothetical protein CR972_00950 [Candidatus Moraniibacteriota bacterium]|nr:MAG: hypothetical protein CR972_00950 [Candidatus Moranbacteria bacterium]